MLATAKAGRYLPLVFAIAPLAGTTPRVLIRDLRVFSRVFAQQNTRQNPVTAPGAYGFQLFESRSDFSLDYGPF